MAQYSTYGSYVFRDKDPVIDELRTLLEDELGGRLTRRGLRVIEHSGGPKVGTTANWFFGVVRRPANPGVEACGRAAGFRRRWVRDSELKARAGRLLKKTQNGQKRPARRRRKRK